MADAVAASGKTAPLGAGLRACQLYFALQLLVACLYAFATPPASFAYDFSLVFSFILTALSGVCIWLLQERASSAREICIGSVLVGIAASAVDMFSLGAFEVVTARFDATLVAALLAAQYAGGLAVVAYLALSARAECVLTVKLDRSPVATSGQSWDVPLRERVKTPVFWRDIIIYFVVFSFMGHWAEMLFGLLIHAGVLMGDVDFSVGMIWEQWLFPFCAEGVAVVLIVVALTPVKEALLRRFGGRKLPAVALSAVATGLVCTSVDFLCGMICNQDYSVWDYRHLPFNFMGQICLQNSVLYTVAAMLILWIFYPKMDRALRRLPKSFGHGICIELVCFFAFCCLLHFLFVGAEGLVVGSVDL